MLNSKSKKISFVSSLVFHLGVLLICFFTSIGYTNIDIPTGLEIEFMSYSETDVIDDIHRPINNVKSVRLSNKNEKKTENIITEKEETIEVSHAKDTINALYPNKSESKMAVSSELENALSKLSDFYDSEKNKDSINNAEELILTSSDTESVIEYTQDGYILSDNRFAVQKVKPNYSCEEFGKVVVRVWVNREGKTIKAEPGVRGTTESATCLFNEAKYAALQTTWTPYLNAPEVQVGQITYNFHKY